MLTIAISFVIATIFVAITTNKEETIKKGGINVKVYYYNSMQYNSYMDYY